MNEESARAIRGLGREPGTPFDQRFAAVLPALGRAFSSKLANCFVLPDPCSGLPAAKPVTWEFDLAVLEAYTSHYSQFDPCIAFGLAHPGVAHRTTDFLTPQEYRRNPYTAELYPRLDVRFTLGVSVAMPQHQLLGLGLHRGGRRARDFGSAEVEVFQALACELSAAAFDALVEERWDSARAEVGAAASPGLGAVELDRDGEVESVSGQAQQLLSTSPALAATLRAHSGGEATATGVVPIPSGGWVRWTLLPRSDSRAARALIQELAPGSWSFVRAELSTALLTPREEEVAALVVAGHPTPAIAAKLGAARATVKRHILRVYAKTGVSSRPELLAKAFGLRQRPEPHPGALLNLTPRERSVVTLALEGLGNKQIAYRLGLATVTVKLHLRSVYRKTGAADRNALARLLLRKPLY